MQEDFAENGAVQGNLVVIWHGVWYPVGNFWRRTAGYREKRPEAAAMARTVADTTPLTTPFYENRCGIMEI